MKPGSLQNTLRVLIVLGGLGGFSGGWALFAHAGKPAAPPLAAQLAPLPTPDDLELPQLQPLPSLPSSPAPSFTMPRLRTRGS